MKVIDLTHTISEKMTVFPGSEQPVLKRVADCDGDGYRETLIDIFSHTGTHVDPPAHVIVGGKTLDEFPAEQFMGKALVIDCRELEGAAITADHIRKAGKKLYMADFLLFNTGWDKHWGSAKYFSGYPCLDKEAVKFMAGKFKGVGFDSISPDPVEDENLTIHKQLLKGGNMIIIENLKDLDLCGDRLIDFCCLPLKYEDSDGAPARAVARLHYSACKSRK